MAKKKQYEVSVVVVTYYPDYRKLLQTLYSVIIQKDVSFEIIVSDDGTEGFEAEKVKAWFETQQFTNFKILDHSENQGTVKNALSGVEVAEGKYVKLISPGDYLYDRQTLKKVCAFMKEKNSKTCFGKALYYSQTPDGCQLHENQNPRYLKPYLKQQLHKIQQNYLIYKDYILGAAFVSDTECLLKYLYDIVDKVTYAEDCAVICMVADGIRIDYFEDGLIWYEYGTGISTAQSEKWNRRLWKDNESCFDLVQKKHPEWEKAYRVTFDETYNKKFLKKVRFFLQNKRTIVYRKLHNIKQTYDMEKLQEILTYDAEF